MNTTKIIAGIIFALVLTNLISWKQNADLFAKNSDVKSTFVQEGEASWYGPGFHGHRTASGERFNTYEMTAAHKTLPFNTMVKVTNLINGLSVVVRINDRGPFVNGRIIDLSHAAKEEIQMGGTAPVRLEIFEIEEEVPEEEDNFSPVNLFDEEFPPTSKIFVEWMKDSANSDFISEDELNQIFNSYRVRTKVLTPNVADANSKIYQDLNQNGTFNYFDITRKVKFISGYTIETAVLPEKSMASDLIKKLESKSFNNIFLEEIIYDNSTSYKVFVGNFKTLEETHDDLNKLHEWDNALKLRLVKIGT